MRALRARLTYANVMSTLALFIVLGGGAYAAATPPKNSVGSKQIKRNAVSSTKVKDRSLLAKDFKAGQVPAGPKGDTGTPGAPGTPGTPGSALAFAHILVAPTGATVDAQRSQGIAQANGTRAAIGIVCFKGLGFTPRNGAANGDGAQSPLVVITVAFAPDPAVLTACGSDAQAAISIQTAAPPANVDHDVYVSFN